MRRFRWGRPERLKECERGYRYIPFFGPMGFEGNITGPTIWWLGDSPWGETTIRPNRKGLYRAAWIAHYMGWPRVSREESRERWESGADTKAFARRCDAKRWMEAMASQAAELRQNQGRVLP